MQNKTNTTHYQEDPLWKKLAEFPFAEGFSKRLARENGWGAFFTEQVLAEYRKFLYLTQRAGHAVTPSKTVDEAWHLHLLYTRSYWEQLCGEVLNKPLHHEPGTGASQDAAHFAAQYAQTLESYRVIFGTEPLASVWSTGTMPRAIKPRRRALGWLATGLGSAALLGARGSLNVGVLILVTLLVVVVLVAILSARGNRSRTSRDASGGACGSSCGGFFAISSCGSGGDSGGDSGGGSGCGSSCGGGGCGGGGD